MKECIKTLYLILSLLLLPVQSFAQVTKKDGITATILKKDTCCHIVFFNASQDTLYLFDSYICKDFYTSKYLHRYNKRKKQAKLSFLPLLPFLSVHYTDKVIIGERRLINKWQVLYHFMPVPPQKIIKISLPLDVFKTYDYVKDINISKLSTFQDTVKFRNLKVKDITDITIEFAFYSQIDLLNCNNFYKNEFDSNEQASNYTIIHLYWK